MENWYHFPPKSTVMLWKLAHVGRPCFTDCHWHRAIRVTAPLTLKSVPMTHVKSTGISNHIETQHIAAGVHYPWDDCDLKYTKKHPIVSSCYWIKEVNGSYSDHYIHMFMQRNELLIWYFELTDMHISYRISRMIHTRFWIVLFSFGMSKPKFSYVHSSSNFPGTGSHGIAPVPVIWARGNILNNIGMYCSLSWSKIQYNVYM